MKILHLYSNWKWTGPAEHALNLALQQDRDSHEVTFACAPPPPGVPESIVAVARRQGIEPVTSFTLCKHFRLWANLRDSAALRGFVRKERFDVVHTHLPNDHLVAGAAVRSLLRRPALVRTCYDGDGGPGGLRARITLGLMCDAIITVSERARTELLRRGGIAQRRIWKMDVPIDLERFDPDAVHDNRNSFHLAREAIVGGIVARVQKHRRFEVLLEALQIVLREFPNLRFMIIGRGTHIQEVAIKPSQTMGIRPNLIFTGYKDEDFVATLACLDFKVFLVPGSDGSCRAVREAMAMGIPVIAARRGMLPEIVAHGREGLVIEDTPENLAEAILYMIEHPEHRREMGRNARAKAGTLFNIAFQARRIEEVYREVLEKKT